MSMLYTVYAILLVVIIQTPFPFYQHLPADKDGLPACVLAAESCQNRVGFISRWDDSTGPV